MRPTSLTLKNFKAIGNNVQRIDLAPITLLFGPNSAGKSTVLQALIYLKEVLHNRNLNPDKTILGGDWLDLGGFQNLIHMRNLEEAMEITLGFDLNESSLPIKLTDHERAILDLAGIEQPETLLDSIKTAKIVIRIRWSPVLSAPFVECFESYVDESLFSRINCSSDRKQIYLDYLSFGHPILNQCYCEDEEKSLSGLFSGLINPSKSTHSNRILTDILASDRPFKDFKFDDLKEFVCKSKGDIFLLNKIREELDHRATRQAYSLSMQIDKLLAEPIESDNAEVIQYLGVEGQYDALPSILTGLQLDSDIWLSDYEDEDTGISFGTLKLLCQAYIDALSVGLLKLVSEWLDDFTYIGPLRDLPPRNMTASLSPNQSRWVKGLAAWELLYSAPAQLIDEINYWMGDACLKTGYQVVLKKFREVDIKNPVFSMLDDEPDIDQLLVIKDILESIPQKSRIYLQEESSDLEVMPQDIGVGISQLFPVVVLTVFQKNGLVAIEQPELHIHPAIQVELADLFARYALKHNKLILLETHSEHLILRLLRRIRQQTENDVPPDKQGLTKDTVSVQYVEPTDSGTRFRKLKIDDTGDFLDEWPNGFFEERDEELFF